MRLFLVIFLAVLSGCAHDTYRKQTFFDYSTENSRAYNIAKSGGFKRVKDVEVDTTKYDIGRSGAGQDFSKSYAGLGVATGVMSYAPYYFSAVDFSTLGLSILVNMMKPDAAESKNHIFGWVQPENGAYPAGYLDSISDKGMDFLKDAMKERFGGAPLFEDFDSLKSSKYMTFKTAAVTGEHTSKCDLKKGT